MSTIFHSVLRAVSSALEIPVTAILVLFLAFAVFSVGWIVVEFFTERRKMKACLPELTEKLLHSDDPAGQLEEAEGLLRRQRDMLRELTVHPDFSPELRRGLADNLLEKEQSRYDRILKRTNLAARLSPMFGLLGTLIPLGPGIIALGTGDTAALSASLLTAFDTTVAGLIAAAFFLVISGIRRRWYNEYMSDLETLTDCLLELEEKKQS